MPEMYLCYHGSCTPGISHTLVISLYVLILLPSNRCLSSSAVQTERAINLKFQPNVPIDLLYLRTLLYVSDVYATGY